MMFDSFSVADQKTMHGLAEHLSEVRWKIQEGGVPVPDAKIMWVFDQWLRTVGESADYIVWMTGRGHAAGTMPTRADFVAAVLNGPGSSQMKRLETW